MLDGDPVSEQSVRTLSFLIFSPQEGPLIEQWQNSGFLTKTYRPA